MYGRTVSAKLRVALQSRSRLVREGLTALLDAEEDLLVVATVATADEIVEAIDATSPDVVVVVDDTFGSVIREPSCRVISVAAEHSLPEVLAAVRTGSNDRMVTGLTSPIARPTAPRLTERQVAVLQAIAHGLTSSEVATLLGISPKSVDNHKQRIYAKLGVQSQAHAVAVALAGRLIDEQGRRREPAIRI
jgi:DNA-binding NarL/FixJ family response regulator